MMMRFFTLSTLSALVMSSVFAGGDKSAQLQLLPGTPTLVQPKRMAKVTVIDGKIRMTTPWIEVSDFAPTGPCSADEVLVFDHFGTDAAGNPTGGANCNPNFAPGTRFFFGSTYHNPYYANDIKELDDPQYNGAVASSLTHAWFWNPNLTNPASGSQQCIVAVLTAEQFDVECQDVHEQTYIDGVLLDYGVLNAGAGYYYSAVCLSAIGGLQLPTTPADDGDPGTEVLGGYAVIYAQAFDPNTGTLTLASGVQPMLWSPQDAGYIGDSTRIQWDDDSPTDGDHVPGPECFDYTYGVCANPPRILGGMMAFWVSPAGCQPHNGDVDENGCVDDADLLAVLFAFGSSEAGREDANCDGIVDDADLLTVLFNFGSGC